MSTHTPPRGRIRAAQRELTRTRLLDGALDVFRHKGYARTTVDDIVAVAEVTRATFYRHFSSKAVVLEGLVLRSEGPYLELYKGLPRLVEAHDVASVRQWLSAAVGLWKDTTAVSQAAYEAASIEPVISELLRARYAENIDALAAALRQGAGHLNHADSTVYAEVMLAQLSYYFFQQMDRHKFDSDRVVDVIAQAWVSAMAHASARARAGVERLPSPESVTGSAG